MTHFTLEESVSGYGHKSISSISEDHLPGEGSLYRSCWALPCYSWNKLLHTCWSGEGVGLYSNLSQGNLWAHLAKEDLFRVWKDRSFLDKLQLVMSSFFLKEIWLLKRQQATRAAGVDRDRQPVFKSCRYQRCYWLWFQTFCEPCYRLYSSPKAFVNHLWKTWC